MVVKATNNGVFKWIAGIMASLIGILLLGAAEWHRQALSQHSMVLSQHTVGIADNAADIRAVGEQCLATKEWMEREQHWRQRMEDKIDRLLTHTGG